MVYLFDCEGNELANTHDRCATAITCSATSKPVDYTVQFMLPIGYEFSPQDHWER